MIGIDTNVLIRDAVNDDPVQSPQAHRLLASLTHEDPGFVSLVAVVEAVWTLKRAYRADAASIQRFVSALLAAREIVVQAPDVVRRALNDARETGADFSDAVIALLAIDADCDYTVTFDRNAAKLPGMLLLER